MFAVCVLALLCLVSASHSAPLTCEELVRPLDQLGLHHLEGRRGLVAVSLNESSQMERIKERDSVSINFANETSRISVTRIFRFGDSCQYMRSNITLEGSSFVMRQFNLTVTFLHTSCKDCLVICFEDGAKKVQRLYLFSPRREVDQVEMEEFKAQLKCLQLPLPVVMDPTKELCPEQISNDPAAHTEEETEGEKA